MATVDLGAAKSGVGGRGNGVVKAVAMSTQLPDRTSRHQGDIRKAPRRHDEVERRQSRPWVIRQKPRVEQATGLGSWVVWIAGAMGVRYNTESVSVAPRPVGSKACEQWQRKLSGRSGDSTPSQNRGRASGCPLAGAST